MNAATVARGGGDVGAGLREVLAGAARQRELSLLVVMVVLGAIVFVRAPQFLSAANLALSSFLFASAIGVLVGGVIADRTRRHGDVAAFGYASAAILIPMM